MKRNFFTLAGLTAGLLLGVAVSYMGSASAARNGSGTYSLPTGNPVVTGTPISSTWANNTLSDIGLELTNSLDRAGRGAMTAPLQCSNGTISAPALTFASDTDTGLYRIGANNPGMTAGGVLSQSWSATTTTMPLGATVTQSATNGAALTATGNGNGPGVTATGGSSAGTGVDGTGGASSGIGVSGHGGAPNGLGAQGYGDGTGHGVAGYGGDNSGMGLYGIGGAPNGRGAYALGKGTGLGIWAVGGDSSGPGLLAAGGAPNGPGATGAGEGTGFGLAGYGGSGGGVGVLGTGGSTAVGGSFANGTAATGGTRRTALEVTNGDIVFNGVTAPTSTTAVLNSLTAVNLVKAWGNFTANNSASPDVNAAFNVTSITQDLGTGEVTVTIAQDMAGGGASNFYLVLCQYNIGGGTYAALECKLSSQQQGSIGLLFIKPDGTGTTAAGLSGARFSFLVIGAQ